MAIVEIKVPDIGDFDLVDVIEIIVSEGDSVTEEEPLVTLESDKATMDIPSPAGGVVEAIHVKPGDKVSEGSLIATVEIEDQAKAAVAETEVESSAEEFLDADKKSTKSESRTGDTTVLVPDMGDFESVDVIEILVSPGDIVNAEDPILTLESDKATMDIPSPATGVVS